jgi:anti-anti-sigma factor
MAPASRADEHVLVMRPVLKIAGGQIELSWWSGAGDERPHRTLLVGGGPDNDWPELVEEVEAALAAGGRRFLMDLDRVPWMDSRGLGHLVALWKLVREGGGSLAVVCGNERIRNILRISQLDDVLRPWATMAEAFRQFPAAADDAPGTGTR